MTQHAPLNNHPSPKGHTMNIPATITPDLSDAIGEFAVAFRSASEGFATAGRIYAEAVAAHGDVARALFNERIPGVVPSVWRRLEAVGNGSLDHRLMNAASRGAQSLRRLPAPLQAECLDRGVDVLLAGGDSLRVAVDNLQASQVRQVFAGDHVRSLSEQKAFLSVAAPLPAGAVRPVEVRGNRVIVRQPCELTRQDLIRLLGEMG